jgi:hypothetical protein
MTKGPGCLLFTTVISTLGKSPIEASRLFKPRPASMLASRTFSPERIADSGFIC